MAITEGIERLAPCFDWLLRASWQSAILIAAVLLAQGLLRRQLSARWRFNLWLLVVARLVLPFSPESTLSVFNWIELRPAAVVAAAPKEAKAVEPPVTEAAPANPPSALPAKQAAGPVPAAGTAPSAPLAKGEPDATVQPSPAPPRRKWTLLEIASLVWLAGAAGLALQVARLMLRMGRKVRRATPVADTAILALFEECRREMNVRARIRLLETEIVQSPALFGIRRPALLLPPGMRRAFSLEELRHVFLHELAHVKRHDVALNWLLTALQIAHWFNPAIWFGFARMRADRELACDALAISSAREEEAKAYGRTIIKLLETLSRPSSLPGLVGIMEDKHQMRRRISMIARFRKTRHWSFLALALMAALAVTGLTDAVKPVAAKKDEAVKAAAKDLIALKIVDGETGALLKEASVLFPFGNGVGYNGPLPLTKADENGIITLPRAQVAQIGFGVLHPGYAPRAVMWTRYDKENRPITPEIPKEYTIRLERGTEIGGVVRDEAGHPVPGLRVEIKGSTWPKSGTPGAKEYPFYNTLFGECPTTDANGRWSCAHFPREMELIQVVLVRPDNSCVQFHTERTTWTSSLNGEIVKMAELRDKTAAFVMKKGITVRGLALDASGKPLRGITIQETDSRKHSNPLSELRTDKEGRFELPNRDPHQILLKATGPGFAGRPVLVDIRPEMPEVRIEMVPAVPLRVRVVDESGKPIPNVQMTPASLIKWIGKTDSQGRIAWNDPPEGASIYSFYVEGHGLGLRKLAPDEAEQTVKLRKGEEVGPLVTIKAETEEKQPVASFTVLSVSPARSVLGVGKAGVFSSNVPHEKMGGTPFKLRIEAPGFEPFLSEELSFMMQEIAITATLHKAGPVEGVVRLPDGTPVAGARLLMPTNPEQRPFISLRFTGKNRTPETTSRDIRQTRTDGEGRYLLTSPGGDPPVIVVAPNGFMETTLSRLRETPEIRLQPWGRLEGTLLLNSQPKSGVRVKLQAARRKDYSLWVDHFGITGRDGSFTVEQLPPGDYTLLCTRPSHGQWPQNHPLVVKIAAGETTKTAYSITGRTVVGKVRLIPSHVEIDWQKGFAPQMLTVRHNDPRLEPPVYEDYVRREDYNKALEKWRHTPVSRFLDTYEPVFDSDGTFRIEAVPEGVYDLELGIPEPDRGQERREEKKIATLQREVVVPPGDAGEPVDLGALEMKIEADALPRKSILTLSATGWDGRTVDLARYRGKWVLLTFWASGAEPSGEELGQLKAVSDAFGDDSRFAMIGVTLDDKPEASAKYAETNQLKWIQAHLEGSAKTVTTEAWAVDSLPATFLIGPGGELLSRDPKAAHLRASIEELLKKETP